MVLAYVYQGVASFRRETPTRNKFRKKVKTIEKSVYIKFLILFCCCNISSSHRVVINTQIACDIDIRTLTSHQALGQIFDPILDQVMG